MVGFPHSLHITMSSARRRVVATSRAGPPESSAPCRGAPASPATASPATADTSAPPFLHISCRRGATTSGLNAAPCRILSCSAADRHDSSHPSVGASVTAFALTLAMQPRQRREAPSKSCTGHKFLRIVQNLCACAPGRRTNMAFWCSLHSHLSCLPGTGHPQVTTLHALEERLPSATSSNSCPSLVSCGHAFSDRWPAPLAGCFLSSSAQPSQVPQPNHLGVAVPTVKSSIALSFQHLEQYRRYRLLEGP